MFVFDVRIFSGDFVEDFMKQTVSQFHYVVFGETRDFFAIVSAGILESITNNLFRSRARDEFQTLNDLVRLPVFDASVEILLIFTHHHHIHRRVFSFDERMIRNAWAHIGVQAEHFANSYIQTLVAAALRCCYRGF